jgi:hypothetical protein
MAKNPELNARLFRLFELADLQMKPLPQVNHY